MKRFAYLLALVASATLFTGTAAAVAGTHPDNRANHGPGAATLEQQSSVVRPDDRATHGPGAATVSRSTDVVRPDDRATHGPGAATISPSTDVVRPDDRATPRPGAVALEQQSGVVRPDDRATHGPGAVALVQVTGPGQVPVIAPGGSGTARVDGFDWLDAGIGVAAALGLGLILMGGVVLALRRTHSPNGVPSLSPGGSGGAS